MKLLSLFSVSLVLSALGVAVAGDFNQQVEEAVVFYQHQVENAKSIAIAIDDTDNDCSSCSGPCMSIAGVVTCCNDGESIINGKCTGGTSSANEDDNTESGSDSDDDTSGSISKSGSGDNCMTINGVKKCCSGGTLSWKNEKFHCSGEKSAAKGVNPMWMGMLLMMGILVQLY